MMQKEIRQQLIQRLWQVYRDQSEEILSIEAALQQKTAGPIVLDHFAVIDLPGPHTGLPVLKNLFIALGYEERGRDYLADKQNDFAWMAESDGMGLEAKLALPQVVVADFRLHEMPSEISRIIEKYSAKASPFPQEKFVDLLALASAGENHAIAECSRAFLAYFSGRDWPLPTLKEFRTVRAFNELLAWVLVFGRCPNHFTLAVHLLEGFSSLEDFHAFIENGPCLSLNQEGGTIKGGEWAGMAQGATKGRRKQIALADGTVELPTGFVEFVWRYPAPSLLSQSPVLWRDYFTGFIAQQADRVIESLYEQ